MSPQNEQHQHPGGDVPHRHVEGDELGTHGTGDSGSRGAATRQDDDRTLQLREEERRARKELVETGRVQIGKEVVEEKKTLEVPVTREEVSVERHAVERRPSDTPIG